MTAPRPQSTTSDFETKRAERKRHENFDRRCERCDRPSSGRCLRANQHEVFALTQSRDSAAVLKEIGAEPVIADALDAAAVKAAVGRRDAGFRAFRARLAWSASGQVAAPPLQGALPPGLPVDLGAGEARNAPSSRASQLAQQPDEVTGHRGVV